jgi:hypothetical protein
MPGSFHPFLSVVLRYLCGVLPPVTSNFNSLELKTEYESCSFKILTCMKGARSDLSCMINYAKIARAPTRAEMMTMTSDVSLTVYANAKAAAATIVTKAEESVLALEAIPCASISACISGVIV